MRKQEREREGKRENKNAESVTVSEYWSKEIEKDKKRDWHI